ncbi:MAG: hypothetical protein U0J83_03400 [Bulleidia sp.]|nr:hypothetical protein [Bulleidia sp.]
MDRKKLICIAVIIATVLPVCIYCFQIPLGKILVPDIMYSSTLNELFVVIHGTMIITLTLVCETIASFIFIYALTKK